MAEEQIKELKEKIQSQQAEFENYKIQCKQLEQFLEEESSKKQEQIRKLKEEAIKKEKTYGLIKLQLSQLETEHASLKATLAESESKSGESNESAKKLEQAKKRVQELQSESGQLKSELEKSKEVSEQKIKKLNDEVTSMKKLLNEKNERISTLETEIEHVQNQAHSKSKPGPKVQEKKQQSSQISPEKSGQKASDKGNEKKIEKLEKQLTESQGQLKKYEELSLKLSNQVKDLKHKNQALALEKENLLVKLKESSHRAHKKQEQIEERENSQEEHEHHPQEDHLKQANSITALILTKRHYISPFLEFKGDNCMKIYKSTKNGCFEKSLGAVKYKVGSITYDPEELVSNCASIIQENTVNGLKNSVVIFGAKKTTKKYLMASIVQKLKDFLLERIDGSQDQPEAQFIKASPEPEKKLEMTGNDKAEIERIFDRVIEMNQKSPKKHEIKKKGQSKPKARIFKFSLGNDYLEIITSSFTNVQIRDNSTISEALNNLCYGRLPNSLQPIECYRQIILTVNPIVNLYEDCRNTLALANCKKQAQIEHSMQSDWRDSPLKDDLNDTARKKMESIERESEQNSLKIRRLEEDIAFYKNKFDELEVRLKTLVNTHNPQNGYLKKSPVTLSYEKMLKFVHSVQARSGSSVTGIQISKFMDENDGSGSGDEIL